MGGAMEAVAADFILLVKLIRQCIHVGIVRHCLMESCIKHTDLRHIW